MKKAWLNIVVIIIVLISALSGVIFVNRFYFEKETPIQTAEARIGDLKEVVEMSGYVDSESTETIISIADGIISALKIEEGDRVRAGESLCKVRSPELRAKVLGMKADLVAARENLQAALTGSERKMAKARCDFLKANISDLEESMQPRTHIDGQAIKVEIQNGSRIIPGMVLFFLADMERPVVNARMSESYVQKVKAGQPVWITGDFLSGKSLQGKVFKISKFVDKEIGTYVETICKFFNPRNLPLKFGAFADVKVITARRRSVLVVPKEAVIMDVMDYVFEVRGDRVYKVPIEVGIIGEKYVEVLSGLKKGDRVATAGSLDLNPGDKVKY